MDNDELKLAWRAMEQRLDQQQVLLRRVAVERVRSPLRMQAATASGIAVMAALLGYQAMRVLLLAPLPGYMLLSALVVLGTAVACAGAALRMLWLLRIDYDGPIARVQQSVARLRRMCIRTGWAMGVPFWVLWVPLVLVGWYPKGVDLYAAQPLVVWSWLASGAVGMAATVGLGWWARRGARGRLARAIDWLFAGPYIERARASLEEIARFERE